MNITSGAITQGLTPIKKRDYIDYGADGGGPVDKLTLDVVGWTDQQVTELMRFIAADETANQIRLDNPPTLYIADGSRGKPIAQARRRIEVGFGQTLKPAALAALKKLLQGFIMKATTRRTGVLSNMGNWEFVYVKDGKSGPVPIGNKAGIPMGPTDAVILRPVGVPHATVANIGGKRARDARTARRRAARGLAPAKKGRARGFLGQTTAAARRSAVFAGFNVAVRFTDYAVRGEKWTKHGAITGTIMITLAQGKRGRGRGR